MKIIKFLKKTLLSIDQESKFNYKNAFIENVVYASLRCVALKSFNFKIFLLVLCQIVTILSKISAFQHWARMLIVYVLENIKMAAKMSNVNIAEKIASAPWTNSKLSNSANKKVGMMKSDQLQQKLQYVLSNLMNK